MSEQVTISQDKLMELIQLAGFISGFAESSSRGNPLLKELFDTIHEEADKIGDILQCLRD